MNICSIHQPNFMPWANFFNKISSSDIFVILGYCQAEKNGYQNRFNMGDSWLTMPVKRNTCSIREKIYISPYFNWNKLKNKLPKYKHLLDKFDSCGFRYANSLFFINSNIIKKIVIDLNIQTTIFEDYPTDLLGTDRLVDICKHFNCDTYLSGFGAKSYLEVSKFYDSNIKVIFQDENSTDKRPILEVLNVNP